jgi:predicted alpha/beta superfamily hydrolase
MRKVTLSVAIAMVVVARSARAVDREDVVFQIQQTTTFGNSVFVLGDIPELGASDMTRAVKLEPGSYPVWKMTIAIPTGTTCTYRYVLRSDSISSLSNPANGTFLTSPTSASTSPASPSPSTKSVFYHSGFGRPVLNWRQGGGSFTAQPMNRVGPGRGPGEWRWNRSGIGQAQRDVEFYFTDATGPGRDPAAGQYGTPLDAVFVQEGQLFNYVPPPTVSPPVQTNVGAFFSTVLNENRPYRVLRPRGYTQNTSRRYPVLYMHDGQNVFDMGPFGTWNADETANALIAAGQMREMIIVGVDNTANRIRNYLPPDDSYQGQQGQANLYAQFLISELKPVIDANYRTLTGREDTSTMGSSLGGLVSLYFGWDYTATFGRIGALSGSWQFANFPNRVRLGPKRDIRIYMDSGDSGTSQDNAWPCLDLRDGISRLGYGLERDLKHTIGYGHQHNEAAWAARLPGSFRYLFPPTEGPNDLFAESTRPIGDIDADGDVDAIDIELMTAALLGMPVQPEHVARSDIDGDGHTDGRDIAAFPIVAWVNMTP